MKAYLIRRLLLVIPTFLGVSIISFAIIQMAPGSPIHAKLRSAEGAFQSEEVSAEIIERMKKLYGLDQPIPVQYVKWLGRVCVLDFGDSFKDKRPVIDRIKETLPVTLQFNILTIFLVYLISLPIGVLSAVKQRSWLDTITTLILFILYSLPNFWVAMLLMMFLGGGKYLDWFPIHGLNSEGAENWPWFSWFGDRLWHMALPLFCLTYGSLASLSRYMRAGMLDTIRQDYIRTARAYGFAEKVVIFKYAMRNSLIPIITLLGTLLPALIGGSVIIETIFSIPGMGRLGFQAVLDRDYPLIMGTFTMSAILTLIGLIITDVMYAIVDPRIKLE